jgi:hypothetical protein
VEKNEGSKRTCKELGEWAELCFMARASDRGLNVSRPHGDSASYDVGVEQNGEVPADPGEVHDFLLQGIVHVEYHRAET